ncbi:TetR/AcrR family transcriptional regulator [Mycobacterium intracellulare]|uniref:TetR/AcrR family transcriptional regulator n=1 Tax=Mycobacterium intracellulare TaxID=1767 RepID=UPI001EEE0DCF|nr:TetR/AcrR family transcriptional regulator [Mycobacterium intracellulare]MEE3755323.1 TetR/AcrR family transcriptional regulator [Mycobacterium intracellulare]
MDEIARRAGISVPVVYDHFPSKLALYRHLLEQDFGDLASIWTGQLASEGSAQQRFRGAMDAWFAHIERRAFTPRLLFRVTTADPGVRVVQQEIIAKTKQLLIPLVAGNLLDISDSTAAGQPIELDLVFEILSGAVQALSLWWSQHPDTPREFIVDTALDTLWTGLERRR